jgi:hypothetical protein
MPDHPIYKHIEFCRNPETLWRKIESHWDWLGVDPKEQFVVGYPKRGGLSGFIAAGDHIRPGAEVGAHGVRVWTPSRRDQAASGCPPRTRPRRAFGKR